MYSFKHLSAFEQTAVQHTHQLKTIIRDLSAQKLKMKPQDLDSFQQTLRDFIRLIALDIAESKQDEVLSPHINYFLLTVGRYNGLFLQVNKSRALEEEKAHSIKKEQCYLQGIGAKPIDHPLLGGLAHAQISYDLLPTNNIFSEHIFEKNKHFYSRDQKDSGFVAHFLWQNLAIGAGTQSTNLRWKVKSFFGGEKISRRQDAFMRGSDADAHEIEKILFNSGWKNIHDGMPLTWEEHEVFQRGFYYRSTGSPVKFSLTPPNALRSRHTTHFHIGHAAQIIQIENVLLGFDLVNFGCGPTENPFYPRHTQAGIDVSSYPPLTAVFISHNHYDHLCERTLKQALPPETLIIVPVGDGKLLRSFGFQNVVEFASWNDGIKLAVGDTEVIIRGLPARHASGRTPFDTNESLYMGYMIQRKGYDYITIVTGDTAVLNETHYGELENYLLKNNLMVASACIAAGPDRPRSRMECTHQSTADAITFQALLNVTNAKVFAKKRLSNLNPEVVLQPEIIKLDLQDFLNSGCLSMGYHQGCFRLGTLNYNDVDGTLTRTLAALAFYGNTPLSEVLVTLKKEKEHLDFLKKGSKEKKPLWNYYFSLMDEFERVGLINTVEIYASLDSKEFLAPGVILTAKHIIDHICKYTILPQPGLTTSIVGKNSTLTYDFSHLIVNRDPSGKNQRIYEKLISALQTQASKDVAVRDLLDKLFLTSICDVKFLVKTLIVAFLSLKTEACLKSFLQKLDILDPMFLLQELITLRGSYYEWKTFDEEQREEGPLETLLLVIIGLIDNQNTNFVKQFKLDFQLSKLTSASPAECQEDSEDDVQVAVAAPSAEAYSITQLPTLFPTSSAQSLNKSQANIVEMKHG